MTRPLPAGRAATPEDKARVVAALLDAWLAMPELRLGQLIVNTMHGRSLFSFEDDDLANAVGKYVRWHVNPLGLPRDDGNPPAVPDGSGGAR